MDVFEMAAVVAISGFLIYLSVYRGIYRYIDVTLYEVAYPVKHKLNKRYQYTEYPQRQVQRQYILVIHSRLWRRAYRIEDPASACALLDPPVSGAGALVLVASLPNERAMDTGATRPYLTRIVL